MIYNGAYIENGNYAYAYKGHLENKTTIKSIGVSFIPWNIWEKQLIHVAEVEISLPLNLAF